MGERCYISDDYGPYGSGLDGYVHYTQAVDESQKGGGGGRGPSSNGGCLTSIISVMAFVFIVVALFDL